MDIRILIGAVKEKLAPKRRMSESEAERSNTMRGLVSSSEYVKQGKMPGKVKFVKAGEDDVEDEYMTERAMRNESSKNLAKKMEDKENAK